MVHAFKRANIVAIEHNFAFQLVPILLDVIMFYHNDYHVNLFEELIKVQNLVFTFRIPLQLASNSVAVCNKSYICGVSKHQDYHHWVQNSCKGY
jgi:hypothetical protein